MNSLRPIAFGVITFCLVWIADLSAAGENTAFTYQGRLNSSGSPANGVYDFTFQAFDAITGGASIGGTVNVNGVGVSNGLFTALVDLASTPFTGPARWLQISVSTNGAGNFTSLTPRQPLTPSPYSIYAHTAGSVTNGAIANAQLGVNAVAATNIQNNTITAGKIASGQVVKSLNGLTDAVSLTQGGNVTINTVGNSLQISAATGQLLLPFSGSASSAGPVFTLTNSGSGGAAAFLSPVGIGTATPDSDKRLTIQAPIGQHGMAWQNSSFTLGLLGISGDNNSGLLTLGSSGVNNVILRANGNSSFAGGNVGIGTTTPATKLHVSGGDAAFGGNVGVGTTTPQARLDVRGDIRLGSSGQFRATSGDENLRIIRGSIDPDGQIVHGSGFTVTHIELAKYRITFNTPFADTPSVTATCDRGGAITPVHNIYKNGISTSSFIVVIFVEGSLNEFQDASFDFIAVGPR